MRRYLILTIIINFGMCSYAQENINMIEVLHIKQDIVSLENRITDLIKKKPEIANIQGLRQFHIFWLSVEEDSLKKEDYLDHSFLYKLCYGYYHLGSKSLFNKGKKYIRTTTLITNSVGNLVATGDARLVHISPAFFQSDVELAKMFFDNEIDFAFYAGGTFSKYIGIKGNNLFALERTKEGLKIYTWEEFMECCFDKWIYPRKKQ